MFNRSWSRRLDAGSVGRPSFVAEFGLWDPARQAAAEQITASLPEIDLIRVVFADPHGLARSKTLSAASFATVLLNGMDFSPGPFLFDTAHAIAVGFREPDPEVGVAELAGAGDFVLVPDPLTFQILPHQERTAWVIGDEFLRDGSPHPLSSRHALRRVVAGYAAQGLEPIVGLELEWYLTRLLDGPVGNRGNGFGRQGPAPEVAAVDAGYQFNLDAYSDLIADLTGPLTGYLLRAGLPLRTMEHESGPGQVETTFEPLPALEAADAMLFFRTLTKQVCARRGLHASFMALPRLDSFDPSGWHLHQSVIEQDSGRNIFTDPAAPGRLSSAGHAYAQGLLARARDLCLLSVPTVNGYRRLDPDFALSPSTIDLRAEDRTAMVRVLGQRDGVHLENRIGEPAANPYLAMAGQLHSGRKGMQGAAQGPIGVLPRSLRESLTAFCDGPAGREVLGDPLAACLAQLKESEAGRFEQWVKEAAPALDEVTEWEHREYFAIF